MAITTDFKNRMAAISKQYSTASLIKTDNKNTHNPTELVNYGDKPLTWFNPSGGKIKTTSITFADIPSEARADMVVLKADNVWVDDVSATPPSAFYHDFYDLFIANKTGSNMNSAVGGHKGITRNYTFVLYDVELSSDIVETITVTVPTGAGGTYTLENWYEALYQDAGDYTSEVTNANAVARIVFHNGDYPEKIMTARHSLYFVMNKGDSGTNIKIRQAQSQLSGSLNSFKIAYDLDDHKGDNSLEFTKKGSIVTSIEREYEEL